MSIIIHAPNVHQGGGRALLAPLLAQLPFGSVAILDERLLLSEPIPEGVRELRVKPTILARLKAERALRFLAETDDTILSFGNLPPLFSVKGRHILFLQNRHLLARSSLPGFSWRSRVRIGIERLWLMRRIRRVHSVIVQTPSMRRDVLANLGVDAIVMPFSKSELSSKLSAVRPESGRAVRYDFVYVATGEPHKNHLTLLEAWRLLAVEGIRPSLCLTVPEDGFPWLVTEIRRIAAVHSLRVKNAGTLSSAALQSLYRQAGALIYPSLVESLGLPLIEARAAGLSIIAGELDYVRDVVDPEETFDPRSPVSLARAVKRFLGRDEPFLTPIGPKMFLQKVMSDG